MPDIIITPNRFSTVTGNPNIVFNGISGSGIRMEVLEDGSLAFIGSAGQLFGISDNLTGSLMSVNDIGGLPILEVFSDDRVVMGKFNTSALVVSGRKVGIGTGSPQEFLHVTGNTRIDSNLLNGKGLFSYSIASHAEGLNTIVGGNYSHSEGFSAIASGIASHAEGFFTVASGNYAHAEGNSTNANGISSHAEGNSTTARGDNTHAEGSSTLAHGTSSHSEGSITTASGIASHAEGLRSIANGNYSHAEGFSSLAYADYSHAEGNNNTSSGYASHSEGTGTIALGIASHAEGLGTIATEDYAHAQGKYNRIGVSGLFQVGRGTSDVDRKDVIYVSVNSGTPSILSGEWQTNTTGQTNFSVVNFFALTTASGALQSQIAGGGSQVKVTGSANIAIANFTGLGGTQVLYSGGIIFISGSAGGTSSNSDGINLSGNLTQTGVILLNDINSVGSTISGNLTRSGQQFVLISGDQYIYDQKAFKGSGHIEVDVDILPLPYNPFMMAASGDYYVQANFTNKATGLSSSIDIVLTSATGTDSNNYLDIGLNNPGYNNSGFNLTSGNDGYIYIHGGDLVIGSITDDKIKFHTNGSQLEHLRAEINHTGITIPFSGKIIVGDTNTGAWIDQDSIHFGISEISGIGLNRKSILSISDTGWGNTYFQPAPWNRAVKYFGPNNAATQTLYGDTAANVGTLLYTTSEVLSDYTQVTPAAGLSAGLSATNSNIYRGSTLGNNGFFFTCKFILNTVWASGLNTSVYGAPSGCRIFVGLTDQAVAAQVGINEPVGNMIGLNYMWASGGVATNTGAYMQNWAIRTRDNVATTTGNTAMTFQTGYYRFSMNCEPYPNNNFVTWELTDLIRRSGVQGQVTANLPVGSTAMRPMVALGFVSGIKVIGCSMLYVEKPLSLIG